jgi:hypothetical protein
VCFAPRKPLSIEVVETTDKVNVMEQVSPLEALQDPRLLLGQKVILEAAIAMTQILGGIGKRNKRRMRN